MEGRAMSAPRPQDGTAHVEGEIAKDALPMQDVLYHMTTVAVIAVFLVLCAGLWTMSRGTAPNLSQKLMRWRVGLQFLAIVIIVLFTLIAKHSG